MRLSLCERLIKRWQAVCNKFPTTTEVSLMFSSCADWKLAQVAELVGLDAGTTEIKINPTTKV